MNTMSSIKQPQVAVIGAGCAGLAAGTRLTENGIRVTLIEASPTLGGRARGFNWKGLALDNGQHILLGAYRETLRQLTLAGIREQDVLMRLPLQLAMLPHFDLQTSTRLPAPLHMLAGLMTAKGLTTSERLAVVRLMIWAQLKQFKLKQDQPLATLFKAHSQPQRVIEWLWEPLCLAALNTPVNEASAQIFLNVMRDSFTGSRHDCDMLLPKVDLTTMLGTPLAEYIRQKGGEVLQHTPIDKITLCGTRSGNQEFVVSGKGFEQSFSHVILAVSPFRLAPLLEGFEGLGALKQQVAKLTYQPIYTVYLQYAAEAALPRPMTGLTGTYSQWVFDRGQLYGQKNLLAVVISANGTHQSITMETLAVKVVEELQHAFPYLPTVLWHKVVAEKRATFACTPLLARPAMMTPIQNLLIAGDYVAGDYPATIEGAMRSGRSCADAILSQ